MLYCVDKQGALLRLSVWQACSDEDKLLKYVQSRSAITYL